MASGCHGDIPRPAVLVTGGTNIENRLPRTGRTAQLHPSLWRGPEVSRSLPLSPSPPPPPSPGLLHGNAAHYTLQHEMKALASRISLIYGLNLSKNPV